MDERLPLRFPKWQFASLGLLPGIVKVLRILRSDDQWRLMLYFLGQRHSLGGKRPLDLLREGEVGKVLRHAENHLAENTW